MIHINGTSIMLIILGGKDKLLNSNQVPCSKMHPTSQIDTYLKQQLIFCVKEKYTESSVQQIFRLNLLHQVTFMLEMLTSQQAKQFDLEYIKKALDSLSIYYKTKLGNLISTFFSLTQSRKQKWLEIMILNFKKPNKTRTK